MGSLMGDSLCLSPKGGGYGELISVPSERCKCLLLQTTVLGSERDRDVCSECETASRVIPARCVRDPGGSPPWLGGNGAGLLGDQPPGVLQRAMVSTWSQAPLSEMFSGLRTPCGLSPALAASSPFS